MTMQLRAQTQSTNSSRRGFYATAAILLAVTVVSVACNFVWPDLIPINGGFGWDGFFFIPMFHDFPRFFFKHGIDAYHIQRVLPVGIIYYAMQFTHTVCTNESIVHFMQIYQALLRIGSVLIWFAISRKMNFRPSVMFVGFVALFVNFATLKYSPYDPVTTDSTALFLSLLTCLFYLRNQLLPLLMSSLAGLMVWPTTILCAAPLILFPVTQKVKWSKRENPMANVFAIGYASLFCAFSIYAFISMSKMPYEMIPPVAWLLPVSIPAAAFVLYYVIRNLTAHATLSPREIIGGLKRLPFLRWLALGLLIFGYIKLRKLSSGDWSNTNIEAFLYCMSASTRPIQFLIVHVLYFGPIMLTLYWLFKPFCRQVQRLGLGAYILIGEALLFCVNSESRKLVNVLPFVVVALCMMLSRGRLKTSYLIFFGVFSFVLSKVWLPINSTAAQLGWPLEKLFQHGSFEELGSQLFFANFGPSASNTSLLLSAILLLVSLPFLWPFEKSAKRFMLGEPANSTGVETSAAGSSIIEEVPASSLERELAEMAGRRRS